MPIVISKKPEHAAFYDHLADAGVHMVSEADAADREIRAARIGLLNLMPAEAMPATEIQWFRYMSRSLMQVKPVPLKFDNDPREREGGSRTHNLARYTPFSKALKKGLDALIVTGDNLELDTAASKPGAPVLLPFDQITYNDQLREVLDAADERVAVGVYSCLGSHIALDHFHDLQREVKPQKISGVFQHRVTDNSSFMAAMNTYIKSPHSRWGDVPVERLMSSGGIQTLAVSGEVGWLAAASRNSHTGARRLFLQGHPEYDADDLHAEYSRDCLSNPNTPKPSNYYDPETGEVRADWISDARALHTNIMEVMYDLAIADKR